MPVVPHRPRPVPYELGTAARARDRAPVRGRGRRRLRARGVVAKPVLRPGLLVDHGCRRGPVHRASLRARGRAAPRCRDGGRRGRATGGGGRCPRLRPARARPAPAHPAVARPPVGGDHLLEQRAGEEVRGAGDEDRAAVAAHRPLGGRERHARLGQDLRAGARPSGPPDGLPVRLPRSCGCRSQRPAWPSRGDIGRTRAGALRGAGVPARADGGGAGQGGRDRPAPARDRRGLHRRAGPPRHGPGLRHRVVRGRAPARQGSGGGRARRGRERGEPPRRRRSRAGERGGQPRRSRGGPGGELPDHRGVEPGPRGEGPDPDRTAPRRQSTSWRRPTGTSRRPRCSSSSARRWRPSASSWPGWRTS